MPNASAGSYLVGVDLGAAIRAGLLAAISLLAGTAEGAVVQFVHDPPVDTGDCLVATVSWEPDQNYWTIGVPAPPTNTLVIDAWSGELLQLSSGHEMAAPGMHLEIIYDAINGRAPRLQEGYEIGSSLAGGFVWLPAPWEPGLIANVDLSGYSMNDPILIGYRYYSEDPYNEGYIYGYAQLTLSVVWSEEIRLQRVTLPRWAYSSTANEGLTVCVSPDDPCWIYLVALSEFDHFAILNWQDMNLPEQRTGWHVRRSNDPSLTPKSSWPIVCPNCVDGDVITPMYQWTDSSGDDPGPGGVWYYQVTAYTTDCPAEGPF